MVSIAAREKLRTVIIDITVEARQRFAAFSIIKIGALSTIGCEGRAINDKGTTEKPANTARERIYGCKYVSINEKTIIHRNPRHNV